MTVFLLGNLILPVITWEYDLNDGDVTINASVIENGTTAQTVKHGDKDAVEDAAPFVTSKGQETSNTVTMELEGESTVTGSGSAGIQATDNGTQPLGGGKNGTSVVDSSSLLTTGSINGVPGTLEPSAQPDPTPNPMSSDAIRTEPENAVPAYDEVFWSDVEDQLRSAKKGDTVTIDAGWCTTMPASIMEVIAETGVTLVIKWKGGGDIVIDKPYSGEKEYWIFSLYQLPDLLDA